MFAISRVAPPILPGLKVAGERTDLPLKDVSVKATVSGYLVGLDSTLKYHNEGDNPVEVLFRFPLEESFAVVGLEAFIAGRRIKAEVKEKEEAQQTYDDAIASGFSAALAEEKSGDIFSISLGNLPPKTEAELHLKLAGELPIDAEGGVRFTLPSVLKPRYTPQGSSDPLAKIEGGETNQVQHATAPAVFNFNLEVSGADGVSNVSSPTHDIQTETRESRVHVSLSKSGPLDKDLVLLVHYSDPHQPKAIAEPGRAKSGAESWMSNPAVMLNFFPKFSTARAACEFIFVVDRSGSMDGFCGQGSSIKSARETLVLFLKSIPPGCHFNIIGFGSRYQSLFPKSVPYDQKNLDTAVRHAEGLQADLGGTELLGPLRHIFSLPPLSGLPRQVFVLTDGSVSNTSACINEVKRNVKHARCFTFGIGSGASTALVKGLARAGNGTAEFIQGGERMQPKVMRSLKRALQPSITELKAEFKLPAGYEILPAPAKLPTIFNGDKAVVYGIVCSEDNKPHESTIEGTATLRGMILGKTIEYAILFQIPKPSEEETGPFAMPMVHHLAAKSLLKDWEAGEGAKQLKTPVKEAIIKLSIDSSVVSAHTAYVAVDEDQDKPIEGAIQTWDVTAMMVQRESGVFGSSGGFSFGGNASLAPQGFGFGSTGAQLSRPVGGLFGGPLGAQSLPRCGATAFSSREVRTGSSAASSSLFGLNLGSSNSFGKPQPLSFGQAPLAGSFGQAPSSSPFGKPQPLAFGQAPSPGSLGQATSSQPLAFGQAPLSGSFGQAPSSSPFGKPQPLAFGQATSSDSLGQAPSSSPFGKPQPLAFGQAPISQPLAFRQAPSSGSIGQASSQPLAFGQAPSSGSIGQASSQPLAFGQAPLSQPLAFGQAPLSQPLAFGQAPSSQPLAFGQAPSSQPLAFGQAPLSQPLAFGQAPSSQPLAFRQAPLSQPLAFGQAPSSQPLAFGQAGSFAQQQSTGQPQPTPFEKPQPLAFGQPTSSNLLGKTPSGFGQPQSSNVFGQTSGFGEPQSSSLLGQTSAGFGLGQTSAGFGQPQLSSLFDQTSSPLQKHFSGIASQSITSDKLSALISLQQAEGSWKLDAIFAGVLSKSLSELEGACPVGCQGSVRLVWATVLALAYLEACLSGQREEWELMAMKAEFWLEEQSLPAGTTLQTLREAAKKYF